MTRPSSSKLGVTTPSDLEIVLTREFDAPRERVFEAWTQPEHVSQWWGQKDSTLTVCDIDLRPGGEWRYVELAADGNEYPFGGTFIEVAPPERLVHSFVFDVEPFNARPATVTVAFEDLGERTRVIESTVFQTSEDRDEMLKSGMEDGATQSMDRLEAYLRTL